MKALIKNKYLLLLFAVVVIAAFLRFFALDSLPASLSPDELFLGYTAYSLFKTGADIHGTLLPIAFSMFGGSWSLIGYSILTVIPEILFGLNEFSVRFVSALSGVTGVVLIYFIAESIFKNKRTGLFAALTFALSPWNVYFSRMAYETNLALAVFLGGLLCLVKFLEGNNKKSLLPVAAGILFSLTLFVYYSYVIFIPLFILTVFYFYKRHFVINRKIFLAIAILGFSFMVTILMVSSSSGKEISTQGIFNDSNIIYQRVERFRTDNSPEPNIVKRLLHTKYIGVPYQLFQNYLQSFSPSFLFDSGGDKIINDIGYFGKLYPIDAIFFILGFTLLFYKKEKSIPLLLSWLIVAPIASAITKDAPSSTRLFTLMPVFTLIIAFGINQTFTYLKDKKGGLIMSLLVVGFLIFNYLLFIDAYYIHFNYQRVRFFHYGFKQIVELSQRYPDYKVVMRGPDNFPCVYFLFYNKVDPREFISQVKYYQPTDEGFVYVKSFGRYSFPFEIDYLKPEPKTIYVDFYDKGSLAMQKMAKIYLPSGEPILVYNINN